METLSAIAPFPTVRPNDTQHAAAERKAQEFEALVLSQLLKPMFETVSKSGLFGDGPEQESYNAMLNDEFAKAIAERGGIGIADQVKDALIRIQSSGLSPIES